MISDHLRCCRRGLSSSSVPEEITELIIARVLCIKTILRCTSVCKSWYAFINSASFVKSLTCRIAAATNNDDVNKLLLCKLSFLDDDCMEESFQDSDGNATSFEDSCFVLLDNFIQLLEDAQPYFALHVDSEDFKENCKLVFPRRNLQQLDACNGLICYNTSDEPDCLYLWNPTIQKQKKISTPLPNLNNNNNNNNNNGDYHAVFKLWFDNKVNDFRILWITNSTVEVFSLITNSWMLITDDAPLTNTNSLAYVNGIFYWPALRDDGNWILISLDLQTGVFRERLTSWTASTIYLTPSHHNASLVILGYGDKDDFLLDLCFHGCVFEVYNYSLDKFHKFDISCAQGFQPLGVRNNDELLLQDIYSPEIVSYSVDSEKFRKFIPATSHKLLATIPFVQTLALLNDADATRIQQAPNN